MKCSSILMNDSGTQRLSFFHVSVMGGRAGPQCCCSSAAYPLPSCLITSSAPDFSDRRFSIRFGSGEFPAASTL